MSTAVQTLHWDFFGPDAEGKARHFVRHLEERLEREGWEGCTTGVASAQPGHFGAWCRTPEAWVTAMTAALRPRRVSAPESDDDRS